MLIDKPLSDGKICQIPFTKNETKYYHCGYNTNSLVTNQCLDKNGELFKCNLGN